MTWGFIQDQLYLINTLRKFSEDIQMSFGMDMLSVIELRWGKMVNTEEVMLPIDSVVKEIEDSRYKYLGMF